MRLSDIFIRVLCIGSVLLYAASASLISDPKVQISSVVVAKLVQLKENPAPTSLAPQIEEQFLLTNLTSRINNLESLFRIIGAPQQPLSLMIDHDRPLRVSIGATDLILGSKVAKASGQLEHAIVKAWIRQLGSSEVLNNPVRAEIYADLILATYFGGLSLQDPENTLRATFEGTDDWINDLHGTSELCGSAWRPAELISYCNNEKQKMSGTQTSYSLRKVIGSLIWEDLQKNGLLQRRAVLNELSRNIRTQGAVVAPGPQGYDTIEHLKASIETEAKEIYPNLVATLPSLTPNIGVLKGKKVVFLGGFEIAHPAASSFKKLIIESCGAPTLSQLLKRSTQATEHILLVQNCEEKSLNYRGFAKAGPARFALENKTVKFAYVHRESLKLADKMINNFEIQAALAFNPQSKDAKFLGLDQKIYREDLGAYKVNGPIGAIEWYRPAAIPKTSSVRESHS